MKTFQIIGIILVVLIASVVIWTCNKGTRLVNIAADNAIENSLINYEQFQDLYNTCIKLNTDIGNMQKMPDNDKSFDQFSKAQRILSIKTQLNKWVEDYNSKSKQWNRSLWKSKELPYQLDVNDFSNYNK